MSDEINNNVLVLPAIRVERQIDAAREAEAINAAAQRAYFEHVDSFGWPNGLPAWGELDTAEKTVWVSIALGAIEAYENARAAIAALPGWQPIDSAPKDGTKIDLLFPGVRGRTIDCFWCVDRWTEPHGGWFWLTPKWGDKGELLPEKEWGWNCYPNMQPTHWMPRPAMPEAQP